MEEVADWVGITPAQVQAVASFYTMYKRKRTGSTSSPAVPRSLACSSGVTTSCTRSRTSPEFLTERPTQKGLLSVEHVECIGACGGAPAVQVNYELIEGVTPDRARDLVRWLGSAQPEVVNTDEMQELFGGVQQLRLGDQRGRRVRSAPIRPSSRWARWAARTRLDDTPRCHQADDRVPCRLAHHRPLRGDRRL